MDGALVAELTPLRQQRDDLLAHLGDRRPGGPLADVPATAATALGQLGELIERGRRQLPLRHRDRRDASSGVRGIRRATQLTQQLRDRRSDHMAAAEKLEQQRAAEEEAQQAVTAAEETLEGQKRLNAAAYAAAGLQPGDACLICDHELPDGFVPRHAPGLHDAEQALKKTRAHAKRKADLTTAALSKERETCTVAEQIAAQLTDTSAQRPHRPYAAARRDRPRPARRSQPRTTYRGPHGRPRADRGQGRAPRGDPQQRRESRRDRRGHRQGHRRSHHSAEEGPHPGGGTAQEDHDPHTAQHRDRGAGDATRPADRETRRSGHDTGEAEPAAGAGRLRG